MPAKNESELRFKYTIHAKKTRGVTGAIILVSANNRADALFRAGMIYQKQYPSTDPDKVEFQIRLEVSH